MSDVDFYNFSPPADAMDTTGGADSTRTENFIEILQQLDPLPDLPENVEDRFFTKEALDFQYATGPADNPPFPTWGAPSAEIASMAAAPTAAAAAAAAATATATAMVPASPAAAVVTNPGHTPSSCGIKRSFAESQQNVAAQHGVGGRGAVVADRCVFLRQRIGGESVSSGNSSTSMSSDSGSACDEPGVLGEWGHANDNSGARGGGGGGGGAGGGAGGRKKTFVQVPPAFPTTAAGTPAPAAVVAGSGSSVPHGKAARRRRHAGTKAAKGLYSSKSAKREGRVADGVGGSVRSGSVAVGGRVAGAMRGYASWDTLVKPLKQQWDHVDAPSARLSSGAATSSSRAASPVAIGRNCSVFSAGPRPRDATAFSVEQCSAQAHPTAVASYVLRVRCAGGAHIVRRTWDDIVSLCTMLGRDLALPASGSKRGQATAARGSGGGGGGGGGAAAAAAAAAAVSPGVEFAPADVVAPDAASGFLGELLARPGKAWATPVRRFLELEYLDGTCRGGAVDESREKAAREVASMAAAVATASSGVHAVKPAASAQPEMAREAAEGGAQASGAAAAAAAAAVAAPGPATGVSSGTVRTSAVLPGMMARLPAHPDAARDLAAVCRCLGELGAAAFTCLPRVGGGAAPFWGAAQDDRGVSGSAVRVAPQRGCLAVLA